MTPLAPLVAAGTVLWRPAGDGPAEVEIALVHRPKYDDWSLPKGKGDPGEHPVVTAVRETLEETGFTGPLGRRLGQVAYLVHGPGGDDTVPKVVHYWAMEALGGAFTASVEVDRIEWLRPVDALTRLSRPDDGDPVRAFVAAPAQTVSVVLVRHAHAGDRKKWDGPDASRPLNRTGLRQADAIAPVAACFGLTAVRAADITRCEQTVAPLAEALGVAVESDARFAEKNNSDSLDPALTATRALLAAGRPVAVCSQGGVIPALVASFGAEAHLSLAEPRARKGSLWVLSAAAGQVVAVDYIQSAAAVL